MYSFFLLSFLLHSSFNNIPNSKSLPGFFFSPAFFCPPFSFDSDFHIFALSFHYLNLLSLPSHTLAPPHSLTHSLSLLFLPTSQTPPLSASLPSFLFLSLLFSRLSSRPSSLPLTISPFLLPPVPPSLPPSLSSEGAVDTCWPFTRGWIPWPEYAMGFLCIESFKGHCVGFREE